MKQRSIDKAQLGPRVNGKHTSATDLVKQVVQEFFNKRKDLVTSYSLGFVKNFAGKSSGGTPRKIILTRLDPFTVSVVMRMARSKQVVTVKCTNAAEFTRNFQEYILSKSWVFEEKHL